jgi:hypothetical protein
VWEDIWSWEFDLLMVVMVWEEYIWYLQKHRGIVDAVFCCIIEPVRGRPPSRDFYLVSR